MKAVRCFEHGGPDVLRYVEVPMPILERHDVLVRVHATSVTRWDLTHREGRASNLPGRAPFTLPLQLGRESAGVVAEIGEAVSAWSPGDRVITMTCPACGQCAACRRGKDNLCTATEWPGQGRLGGYAEYIACNENELLPAPDVMGFEKLGCALWSYSTALHMARRGGLGVGDDVVVTGATGGMGTAGIQIAQALGARHVIGITGTAEKVGALEQMGVHALNYRLTNVPEQVKKLTQGKGADVALDMVGGPMLSLALASLAPGGIAVAAAVSGGREIRLDIAPFLAAEHSLVGIRGSTRDDQVRALDLLATGRVDPMIATVLPLAAAAEAHRLVASQKVVGKVVLVP